MKKHKKKSKLVKTNKVYILVVFIGITFIIYPSIAKFINNNNQTAIINGYIEKIEKMQENDIIEEKEKYENYNIGKDKIDLFKEGELLGLIEIPKINLRLPIYEGTDDNTLLKGVGHIRGTSMPVKKREYNCILVGHSGLSTKTIFDNITKLKINDEFIIKILDETFIYKINETKKILPSQTDNLKMQSNKGLVTLVTCTPKYVNSHRLLIIGEEVHLQAYKKQLISKFSVQFTSSIV